MDLTTSSCLPFCQDTRSIAGFIVPALETRYLTTFEQRNTPSAANGRGFIRGRIVYASCSMLIAASSAIHEGSLLMTISLQWVLVAWWLAAMAFRGRKDNNVSPRPGKLVGTWREGQIFRSLALPGGRMTCISDCRMPLLDQRDGPKRGVLLAERHDRWFHIETGWPPRH